MNRGVDRGAIFRTQGDAARFVDALGESVEGAGASVVAYSLMTNHYHLLLRCEEGGLSTVMHRLGSRYARSFNDRVGRDGPLFRSRFLSKLVESWEYRVTAARYIHRNPLDLDRARPLSQYRWSSYGSYLGVRPVPSWLDPSPVLEVFGQSTTAYQESVEDCELGGPPDPASLMALLHLVVGELPDLDTVSRRRVARSAGIVMIDEVSSAERKELISLLGFSSARALRAAQMRAAATAAEDANVRYLLDRLRAA